MNKLFSTLAISALLAVGAQATTIQITKVNDKGQLSDVVSTDGYFTGKVDLVTLNSGLLDDELDALIGKFAIIDLNSDLFYISTSKVPGNVAANAVFTANFGFDITNSTLGTSAGYTLSNVVINNTIGSVALDEFALNLLTYPGALYTFSLQEGVGNGQIGTVPEPGTLGLIGLGLFAVAFAARRRKTV